MDKIKLKPNQEVIYFDGVSILDKTLVKEINKEQGTAKLANGIVIKIESTKKGYFKRSGIRSEAKAWLNENDNDGVKIYRAYSSKARLMKIMKKLESTLKNKSITFDRDQAWLNELYKTLNEFIEK